MYLGSSLAQPSPHLLDNQHRNIIRMYAQFAITDRLHQGVIALPETRVVPDPHARAKMQVEQV